jgi:hypothetical protein
MDEEKAKVTASCVIKCLYAFPTTHKQCKLHAQNTNYWLGILNFFANDIIQLLS